MHSHVIDSSVLIEFAKWKLIEDMFRLPFGFVVPDVLYDTELIDLRTYSRDDLSNYGLVIETLDGSGVATAQRYQAQITRLSIVDSFALALASSKGHSILTGDKAMRQLAEREKIEIGDSIWLINQMVTHGIQAKGNMRTVLKGMLHDRRCSIPYPELTKWINKFSD